MVGLVPVASIVTHKVADSSEQEPIRNVGADAGTIVVGVVDELLVLADELLELEDELLELEDELLELEVDVDEVDELEGATLPQLIEKTASEKTNRAITLL
jgi:hypothetical protein